MNRKNTFSGQIDSTKGSCLKGRKAEVIRKHGDKCLEGQSGSIEVSS